MLNFPMNKHVTDRLCSMQCIFMQNWCCKSSAKVLPSNILLVFFLQKLITCSLNDDLDFLPPLSFSHNLVRTLAELHVLIGFFDFPPLKFKKGWALLAILLFNSLFLRKSVVKIAAHQKIQTSTQAYCVLSFKEAESIK